jgi:hypothetical protein
VTWTLSGRLCEGGPGKLAETESRLCWSVDARAEWAVMGCKLHRAMRIVRRVENEDGMVDEVEVCRMVGSVGDEAVNGGEQEHGCPLLISSYTYGCSADNRGRREVTMRDQRGGTDGVEETASDARTNGSVKMKRSEGRGLCRRPSIRRTRKTMRNLWKTDGRGERLHGQRKGKCMPQDTQGGFVWFFG